MKEIFVVDSYAKSAEQTEMLGAMVEHLTKAGREICLVSHLPIPERVITPKVRFTLFDSNNILRHSVATLSYIYRDIELRWASTDLYHGAAVYVNLYNALRLLAGRYEWVHFIEYDLNIQDVENHLQGPFAQMREKDWKVIGYQLFASDPALRSKGMMTNLFSLKPEIVEVLPAIHCWDDYEGLCTPDAAMLETWLLERFKAHNIPCAILEGIGVRNKSNAGGDYILVKCRQHNPLFSLFFINQYSSEIEIKLKSGVQFRLGFGQMAHLPNVAPVEEVAITYVGTAKVVRHSMEAIPLGAFKKQGFNYCPDWCEAPGG